MLKQELTEDKSQTIRVLRSQVKIISKLIAGSGLYSNESDFIRQAIREKIDRGLKK